MAVNRRVVGSSPNLRSQTFVESVFSHWLTDGTSVSAILARSCKGSALPLSCNDPPKARHSGRRARILRDSLVGTPLVNCQYPRCECHTESVVKDEEDGMTNNRCDNLGESHRLRRRHPSASEAPLASVPNLPAKLVLPGHRARCREITRRL